ncbi:MAG: aldo/keto reductase, partial [Candidatus Omnitrophica bacterium]|nr:aldo/keto reductase [Candidatus Omnitrophota bacterium]
MFKPMFFITILTFLFNSIAVFAQSPSPTLLNLPTPGELTSMSPRYVPLLVKGIKVNPKNPLEFDFIMDTGEQGNRDETTFKEEASKLIKYFLASLTVPEQDLWVNLSPYEKNRIIPNGFAATEMGRDLLSQDYLLKQLTASLMHPDGKLGKRFWDKIYMRAKELYGTAQIPVNTFNKVWIVPDKASIYQNEQGAFVVGSHLKVMLEEDYLALQKTKDHRPETKDIKQISQIVKETIVPAIEKEVNEGKNFALLRQIYHSMILAAWYKKNLKQGLLSRVYVDKNKVKGIDDIEKAQIDQIYDRYLKAFKKGAMNFIREDYDAATQTMVPRKYFAGGMHLNGDYALVSKLEALGDVVKRAYTNVRWQMLGVGHRLGHGVDFASLTKKEQYLYRIFGKTGLKFFVAGHGAIWTGRKWPTNNEHYIKPSKAEVFASYDIAFQHMDNQDGITMIDTAPAYGEKGGEDFSSEEWIGEYFREHPELRKKAFISTKVGEEPPPVGEVKGEINHTVDHLHVSVQRSLDQLGKIDLLYIHQADAQVLGDESYKQALLQMKQDEYGGIKFLGASISNKDVLEEVVNKDLIDWLDAVQIPAWLFNERKDLIQKIYAKGIAIVINSAGRSVKDGDYRSGYINVANDPRAAVILVGTRGHLKETVNYFTSEADKAMSSPLIRAYDAKILASAQEVIMQFLEKNAPPTENDLIPNLVNRMKEMPEFSFLEGRNGIILNDLGKNLILIVQGRGPHSNLISKTQKLNRVEIVLSELGLAEKGRGKVINKVFQTINEVLDGSFRQRMDVLGFFGDHQYPDS